MRWATTRDLIALNDVAVQNDYNQWLTARFFDDVDPAGVHLIYAAKEHGIRPGSRRDDWAPHARCVIDVEMADGSTTLVLLDVSLADMDALNDTEGPPTLDVPADAPVAVIFDDGEPQVVDGRHLTEAMRRRGVRELEVTAIPTFSPADRLALRQTIQEGQ